MPHYRPATGTHREMRGSKRRTVLQLGSPSKSSYLSRYGYGRNEEADNSEEHVQKEQTSQQGLSLLGQYADSDSEEESNVKDEGNDDAAGENADTTDDSSHVPEVDKGPVNSETTEIQNVPVPSKSLMDNEVASFLAEIEAISTDQNSQDGLPEMPVDRNSPELDPHLSTDTTEEIQEKQTTNYYKQFVKGESEFVRKPDLDKKKLSKNLDEEVIIEEPVSLFERCLDENTQYHYFWNTITNAVTWELPEEYTQYLLQKKEFEEKIEKFKKEGQKYKIKSNKDNDTKSEKSDSVKEIGDRKRQGSKERDKSDDENDKDNESVTSPHIPSAAADPIKSEKTNEELKRPETPVNKDKVEENNVVQVELSDTSESKRDKHRKKKKKHKRDNREEGSSKSRSSRRGRSRSRERSSRKSRKEIKDSFDKESKEPKEESIDIDIDLDDIDKALEMALENKTTKKSKKDSSSGESSSRTSHKRSKHKHSRETDAAHEEPVTKRTKLVDYSVEQEDERSEGEITDKMDRKEEKKMEKTHKTDEDNKPVDSKLKKSSHKRKNDKLHILDMAELCLSKLEFLEITKKGLSKLQILLIEIETRYNDWQSGVLESEYFLMKLKLANNQLKLYEESAAPSGWTCSWDRPYRRYFYTNEVTGESQWDYPEAAEIDQQEQPPSPMEEGEIPDELSDHDEDTSKEVVTSVVGEDLSNETAADTTTTTFFPDSTSNQVVTSSELQTTNNTSNTDTEDQQEKEVSDTEMASPTAAQTEECESKEEGNVSSDVKQIDLSESFPSSRLSSLQESDIGDESESVMPDESVNEAVKHSADYTGSNVHNVPAEQTLSSSEPASEPTPPLPPIIYPGQPPPPGTEFLIGLLAPPPPPPPPDQEFDVPVFYGPQPQNGVEGQKISSQYDASCTEGFHDSNYQYGEASEMIPHSGLSAQYPTVKSEPYVDQQHDYNMKAHIPSEMYIKQEPGQDYNVKAHVPSGMYIKHEPGQDYNMKAHVPSDMYTNQDSGYSVKSELDSYEYAPTDDSTMDSMCQHEVKTESYFDDCSESDIPLSKSPQIFTQEAGDSNSLDQPLPLKDAPDSPDPTRSPSPEGIIIGGNPVSSNASSGRERVSHSTAEKSNSSQDSQREKKKKKDKMSTGLALKRKGVSSLVQKWQKVKKEVEKEEQDEERRQQEIRKKLDEWKKDYL